MNPVKKQLPLIPYLRKSSGEDEALSFDRQLKAIQSWAALHDVKLTEPVLEPHVSGSKDWKERALGQAISAVSRGDAAGIIVEEQNRLTRGNGLQRAEIWEELKQAKARLVITSDGTDTANGDYELLYDLKGALAAEQWREYKRRSDAVKANRIDQGVFIGPAPTGYTKLKHGGLFIDPKTAPLVRHLFEMRASGSSWGELLRYFDEATGRTWTQPGIGGIIRNPVYRGDLVYGDLINEGAHEAIVDTPLWHAAQRKGKAPAKPGPKSQWPLAGRVQCGQCGSSMIGWRGATSRTLKRKDGSPYVYEQKPSLRYTCKNRKCKPALSVKAPEVEAWLMQNLWQFLGSRVAEHAEQPDLTPLEDAVTVAQRRLDQVMAPEARDDLGDLWSADVKARRLELEEAQAAFGMAQVAAGEADVASVTDLRERWDEMDVDEKREALALYGVRVRINGKTPDTWEIVWR